MAAAPVETVFVQQKKLRSASFHSASAIFFVQVVEKKSMILYIVVGCLFSIYITKTGVSMFADEPELDELSIYMDDDFDDFDEDFDDDFDDDEDDVLDEFDSEEDLYYDDVFKEEEDIDEPYDDVEPEDGYNLRHRNDDDDDISFIDKYDL